MHKIEIVFDKNVSLESILNEIIDINLEKNFDLILKNYCEEDIEKTSYINYNNSEKIDCVALVNKGGTQ